MKQKISPRVDKRALHALTTLFGGPYPGISFAVEAFPGLYAETLKELRGVFTRDELLYLISLSELHWPDAPLAGYLSLSDVERALTRPPEILAKLGGLTVFQRATLEVWAAGYLHRTTEAEREVWLSNLLPGHD